ncbi:3'-5' exonuclease KapD [Desulfosporosinus sp. SYSU MS00001]|uniref:3'-5' exonuclease KapD n=1 Tax=Desulfosporosinus sp. SYSU MS00001 TaxID=3416284 RepID=UPI003CECF614
MNYLVVDFEFTMWAYGNPRVWFPEIIEVGAIVVDHKGNPMGLPYSAFTKPRLWPRITDECFGITGIRQKDIEDGIPLENALYKLQNMAKSENITLVAWGNEDRKVLSRVCEKYGLSYPFTYENYVDLALSYRNHQNLKNHASLKRAIESSEIEMSGIQHSAMDDAINAALVMKKMISDGWKIEEAIAENHNSINPSKLAFNIPVAV